MDREQKRDLRKRTRAEQDAIRAVLLQWDPIVDVPDDEYDCLIVPIHRLLTRGASEPEIAATLTASVQPHFGLAPAPETDAVAANQLITAWRGLPSGHRTASSR